MNKVEEFFQNNKGVYYSIRSIAKKTGIKRRAVHAICSRSNNIKKLENNNILGCGKKRLSIFFA